MALSFGALLTNTFREPSDLADAPLILLTCRCKLSGSAQIANAMTNASLFLGTSNDLTPKYPNNPKNGRVHFR